MSSANLELVCSPYAAWEHGDCGSAEWAHDGIEFPFADGLDPRSSVGPAAMAEGMRASLSRWEGCRHRGAGEWHDAR